MYNVYKNEIAKVASLRNISFTVAIIILITLIITIFEYNMIFQYIETDEYSNFLVYNLSFVLMKFILPIAMIIFTASLFADEYSKGQIKYYLICGTKHTQLYIGKITFLLTVVLFLSITIYCTLCVFGLFISDSSININELIKIGVLYFVASVGIIPVVLLTTVFSFYIKDFSTTIITCIVVYFLFISFDSVFQGKFYTPTSLLTNATFFYYNPLILYFREVIVVLIYFMLLPILGLVRFKQMDIWK